MQQMHSGVCGCATAFPLYSQFDHFYGAVNKDSSNSVGSNCATQRGGSRVRRELGNKETEVKKQ